MKEAQQAEALRLADELQQAVQSYPQRSEEEPGGYCSEQDQIMDFAASELRRQHARILEIEAALSMMYEFFEPNAWGSSENKREALEAASNALGITQEKQG